MNSRFLVAFVLMPSILLFGCTKNSRSKEPNVELIQDMMEQAALKPQDFEPHDREKAASRLPPEGTVPIGYKPYPYHQNAQAAQAKLKNPFAGDMSPETLSIGRRGYETYCAVCHGYEGKGDGPVAPKMALKPPTVVSEKIVTMNDAGIYHIITDGQGVMASYIYQIVEENGRWAIVNYIRSLQKLSKSSASAKSN